MLYGFLVTLFVFVCLLLVLVVLIQKSKGSIGMGGLGGGSQMLFGGSGGQDLFQKITWGLGAIFMTLSLLLALMKSSGGTSRYLDKTKALPVQQNAPKMPDTPAAPAQAPAPEQPVSMPTQEAAPATPAN